MIKVVFTGVESSGKTTLVQAISTYYEVPRTVEYARLFLEGRNDNYTQSDLIQILQGQFDLEAKAAFENPRMLVCDTGPLVIKVWSLFKYGNVDPIIENALAAYKPDLYILPEPNGVPFEPDPLRENPSDRKELFDLYFKELEQLNIPFIVAEGSFEDRLDQVKKAIDPLLS